MAKALRIQLADHPALAVPGGGVVLKSHRVLVIRGKHKGTLRAFSARCPHKPKQGRVRVLHGPGGCQLICPLHDWTFSRKGKPTGKSKRGLRRLASRLEGDELVIELS